MIIYQAHKSWYNIVILSCLTGGGCSYAGVYVWCSLTYTMTLPFKASFFQFSWSTKLFFVLTVLTLATIACHTAITLTTSCTLVAYYKSCTHVRTTWLITYIPVWCFFGWGSSTILSSDVGRSCALVLFSSYVYKFTDMCICWREQDVDHVMYLSNIPSFFLSGNIF